MFATLECGVGGAEPRASQGCSMEAGAAEPHGGWRPTTGKAGACRDRDVDGDRATDGMVSGRGSPAVMRALCVATRGAGCLA